MRSSIEFEFILKWIITNAKTEEYKNYAYRRVSEVRFNVHRTVHVYGVVVKLTTSNSLEWNIVSLATTQQIYVGTFRQYIFHFSNRNISYIFSWWLHTFSHYICWSTSGTVILQADWPHEISINLFKWFPSKKYISFLHDISFTGIIVGGTKQCGRSSGPAPRGTLPAILDSDSFCIGETSAWFIGVYISWWFVTVRKGIFITGSQIDRNYKMCILSFVGK